MQTLTKIFFFLSFVLIIFGAGYYVGEHKAQPFPGGQADGRRNLDYDLFWNTWSKLEEKYVDKKKLAPDAMFYGAIKGMVSSLDDPYTMFLTPEENRLAKDDLGGKFEGIGAQLGLKNGQIVIIAPLANSPAEKAGVKAGDVIKKVDGLDTINWTLYEAVSKIRGKDGTEVELIIERNGAEKTFTIVRREIIVSSVEVSYEKNVAILKLARFGDDTIDEWNKAVGEIAKKFHDKTVAGMILDLRDNPGGYLDGSVYIASEFLTQNTLVVTQEQSDNTSIRYTAERTGRLVEVPLVILVNKGSASASEIVAGALRDNKRAKLVGENTFGKGSIQEALDLPRGAGLHVTIAKWILPKGDWINSKGVKPDVEVSLPDDPDNTITRKTDLQLEKALELVVE